MNRLVAFFLLVLACGFGSCKKDRPFNTFIVGEHQDGGISMKTDPIEMPSVNCYDGGSYAVSLIGSAPIEGNILNVSNCWGVSPGGSYYGSHAIRVTGISSLGSVDGVTQTYDYGAEIAFDSEFDGGVIALSHLEDYITVKIDSDNREFVGWIKIEGYIRITDFCLYPR